MANTTEKRGRGRPPKSGSRSRSTSSQKNSRSSHSTHNPQQSDPFWGSPVQRAAVGLALCALSLFCLFSIITDSTGLLGGALHRLLGGMFGSVGSFFFCLALAYTGVSYMYKNTRYRPTTYVTACAIAVICISALSHCILAPEIPTGTAAYEALYVSGLIGESGGVIGGFAATGLTSLFGRLSTSVILVIILIGCFIVLTQITPYMFYTSMMGNAKKARDNVDQYRQQRAIAREERMAELERRREQEELERQQAGASMPAPSDVQRLIQRNRSQAKVDIPFSVAPTPQAPLHRDADVPPPAPEPIEEDRTAQQPSQQDLEAMQRARATVILPPEDQEPIPPWEEESEDADLWEESQEIEEVGEMEEIPSTSSVEPPSSFPESIPAPWESFSSPTAEPQPQKSEDTISIAVYNADETIPEDEFPMEEMEKEPEVSEELLHQEEEIYCYPPITLLNRDTGAKNTDMSQEIQDNVHKLVDTLKSFGVEVTVLNVAQGPAVTRYEIAPRAGIKVSKIVNLADDIALNLAASGVRIEAPIPGKAAVGIEVPNKTIDSILIRSIIDTKEFKEAKSKVSAALGKDITGNPIVADLAKMPHVLIAGATGSGKSVCINTIIASILYKAKPSEVKLLMVDPKVVELGIYNGIPHLLIPVVTDPKKAAGALNWAVTEMLNRYKLFADNSVRDMKGYNEHVRETGEGEPLPQIVIIIDELADLMMAAPGDVEDAICRLAQMARAAGMHLVIATQRPSVDVITGVIKANIPSRISFAVSSAIDSRTILDSTGAEKLLGRGDMLYSPVGMAKPLRVQGCFISDKEVEAVVDFIKKSQTATYNEKIMEEIERAAAQTKGKGKGKDDDGGGFSDGEDEMVGPAMEVVIEAGQASVSLLQRRLKLGYARAARIIDQLEERGVIGPYEGSKPRQVLMSKQDYLEWKLRQEDQSS